MPDRSPEPGAPNPRFGEYRVETERMADGRSIHYYSWPADPAPPDANAAHAGAAGAPVPSDATVPRPRDV
jgi:hypothetical protein